MQTVQADSVAAQPWRNGGGRTRELLAWPPGAEWCIRVSLADIETDGPFSAFVGVERWFAVTQGAGVRLSFPGFECVVQAGDEPLRFDGGVAADCSLIDGPTRDLNLMVRREAGTGTMQPVVAGQAWAGSFDQRGLFTLSAGVLNVGDRPGHDTDDSPRSHRVEARCLLWPIGDAPCTFTPDAPGPCGWWLGYSDLSA